MAADPSSDARRNWFAHAVEGGAFMGALALVNAQTLLPSVVKSMGGPEWLVALMPVLMMLGFTLMPVLTAHHVGTLGHFRPLLLWVGLLQRLPYLLAALALIFAGDRPGLCLAAVALAPLLSGLFGGATATAWQQLVARTVPSERRSSLFAVRFAISALLGIAAGWVVAATLKVHPDSTGYGYLHLWAFGGLMVSYLVFSMIREPQEAQQRDRETGLWENVRTLPQLALSSPRLIAFITTTTLFTLGGLMVPYLAIHALSAAGQAQEFLGTLISWQMSGTIVGGLVAGWFGDRHGGRPVMLAARLGFLALCAVAPFVTSVAGWCALFALFGAAGTANQIGTSALQLELLPERGRANHLALMGFVQLPAALIAGLAGAAIWHRLDHAGFIWLAAGSGAALLFSLLAMRRLAELRQG